MLGIDYDPATGICGVLSLFFTYTEEGIIHFVYSQDTIPLAEVRIKEWFEGLHKKARSLGLQVKEIHIRPEDFAALVAQGIITLRKGFHFVRVYCTHTQEELHRENIRGISLVGLHIRGELSPPIKVVERLAGWVDQQDTFHREDPPSIVHVLACEVPRT